MSSEAIRIYEEILTGKRGRFPRGFWNDGTHLNYAAAAEITKYLVEDVLKWNDDELRDQMCCEVFFRAKLKGMLWTLFNDSFYAAVNNAYPDKYKEWEFTHTPRNFWTEETAIEATYWLFKVKLGMSDEDIIENISRKIFVENRLDTMMHVIYGNNATQAVKSAFKHLF